VLSAELAMGVKRHELNDAQWAKIALLLPDKAGDPGRTGSDNRFVYEWMFVGFAVWSALVRFT